MKILLMGEYSNVHWTLAEGLRTLGHQVSVVSDGDLWKDYPRDINLKRQSTGKIDTLKYLWSIRQTMPKLKGYDIVQLINPIFLDLKAERIWKYYHQLKRQNGNLFLGAYGMDHYWVKTALDCKTFRYSDFNMGEKERHSPENDIFINDWLYGEKGRLNQFIAEDSKGIISGLYEYEMSYRPYFPDEKLQFIPFPIQPQKVDDNKLNVGKQISFFIGIQKTRNIYKGTDIMLQALQRLERSYGNRVKVIRTENVPFAEYQKRIEESDILLDQLYSYTPAMNGLLAMSKGIILVGGGEEEQYELMGEQELRPIINVRPSEESVYDALEQLVLSPERIPLLKRQSIEYIQRHHDYKKVAGQYINFWTSRIR